MIFDQFEYDIRCEWGIKGIEMLSPVSDVIIIVDILSFSTSVDIAVSNGATVIPYLFDSKKAFDFSLSVNAILAERDRKVPGKFSLSPSSLINIPQHTRLVLPSPNGSSLSLSAVNSFTLCGCIRNAKAVAEFAMSKGKRISVIPAGEKWPDGSLRTAFEDLAGAGAIISYLKGELSPESIASAAVYQDIKNELLINIKNCSSGKELIERGFETDIDLACVLNVSNSVPGLVNGEYTELTFSN